MCKNVSVLVLKMREFKMHFYIRVYMYIWYSMLVYDIPVLWGKKCENLYANCIKTRDVEETKKKK